MCSICLNYSNGSLSYTKAWKLIGGVDPDHAEVVIKLLEGLPNGIDSMKVDTFDYLDHRVQIVPQLIKGKLQHWFVIDDRPISNVKKKDHAKRLAINFIDLIEDPHYHESVKQEMAGNRLPPEPGMNRRELSRRRIYAKKKKDMGMLQ